jgi:fatty-acyl-CoA synthase
VKDIFASATTLGGLLAKAASTWPESEAVFPAERISFRELYSRARAAAAGLISSGVEPGDHVGLLAGPGVGFLTAMFGASMVGAVVVPVSERFKSAELRHVITHSRMTTLLTTADESSFSDFPAAIRAALPELDVATEGAARVELRDVPALRRILLLAGVDRPGMSALPAGADVDVDAARLRVSVAEPALLMYTSGTSAMPKGCLVSHESVTRQAQALAEVFYELTESDAYWCPLPLFHNGGISTLAACLSSGANFVHIGHFDPAVAVRQLEAERCTHWIPCFETILLPIVDHPSFSTADLSCLRLMVLAGTPEFLRKMQHRLPTITIQSNYGSTEGAGSSVMALPSDSEEIRMTTCGHAFPGMEFRIIDPDADSGRGEIAFRGPQRFLSYYNDPELTAEAIDAHGWFHSGDLGHLTPEGLLVYEGRLKDMLKVGGENVAAAEIEAYLLGHPAVNIASVVGAPDARYTEVPAVYVELVPGQTVTESDLIDYCVGQISTYKVPRYVRFVTEWPMSGTKIQKYVLRTRIADELERAGITQAPPVQSIQGARR